MRLPELISPTKAYGEVLRELGVSDFSSSASVHESLIAEYLRALAFNSNEAGKEIQPIHTRTIIEGVLRSLESFSIFHSIDDDEYGEIDDDDLSIDVKRRFVRYVLEKLEQLGELFHLGGGYWLPCEMKVILSEESQTVFIVGGMPSYQLRSFLGISVDSNRLLRTCDKGAVERLLSEGRLKSQNLNDWLSVPTQKVDVWTAELLGVLKRKMEGYSSAEREPFLYLPSKQNAPFQALRWTELRSAIGVQDGFYLARVPLRHRLNEYYLAQVKGSFRSSPQILKVSHIQKKDVRRMQYGLDLQDGRGTRVQLIQGSEKVRLILRNPLPREETRLLEALGTVKNDSLHRFPKEYTLKNDYFVLMKAVLSRLGVI